MAPTEMNVPALQAKAKLTKLILPRFRGDLTNRSIQGLSLTEANYKSAIEILYEKFGRMEQTMPAHMEELSKLPSCSTSERSNSLRFVYNKISAHFRCLSSLGVASDQYSGLLI